MKVPDINQAIDYANELLLDRRAKFFNSWNIYVKAGLAEFIVYRNRFPTYDTLGALLEVLTKNIGRKPDVGYTTVNIKGYGWNFTDTRAVYIEHRKGIGTFFQLTDTGD